MILILSAALLLQCIASLLVLGIIRNTGRHAAWIIIAAAIFLMSVRQSIILFQSISGNSSASPDATTEIIILGTTVFMVVGISRMFPLFRSISLSEETLRESVEKYRDLYDNAPDMYYCLDNNRKIIDCNETTARMLGYKKDEIIGMPITHFMTDESKKFFEETFLKLEKEKEYHNLEREFIRSDGSIFPVMLNVFGVFDRNGQFVKTRTIARDITTRKEIEKKLHSISVTDDLTGLLNRRGFFALAEQQLKLAGRNMRKMYFLFADLDNLKAINDTLGHHEGDFALFNTAQILRDTFRDSDIIARIGGDEFAVLMTDYPDSNVEIIIPDRIQDKINHFNEHGSHSYELSISLGIVHHNPENPCSIYELVSKADKLMYENKKNKYN